MWSRIQYKRYRWSRQIRSVRNQILRRKRLNFPKKNAEEIARLSVQALPITMVTSFPRSGNTWMRMMLSDVFASLSPMEQSCDQTRNNWLASNDLIPDIYHNDIASRHHLMHAGGELAERFGVFVKTHEDFEQLDRLGPWNSDNVRHLYLFRSPEDSLVSFFHLHRRVGGKQKLTIGGIDRFCLDQLARWKRMTSSYLALAQRSADQVCFLGYETMLARPEESLSKCFAWFGESIDPTIIQRSVERNRFENAKKSEGRRNENRDLNFFRRGKSGGGREELSAKTLRSIQLQTADLVEQAVERSNVAIAKRSQNRAQADQAA